MSNTRNTYKIKDFKKHPVVLLLDTYKRLKNKRGIIINRTCHVTPLILIQNSHARRAEAGTSSCFIQAQTNEFKVKIP